MHHTWSARIIFEDREWYLKLHIVNLRATTKKRDRDTGYKSRTGIKLSDYSVWKKKRRKMKSRFKKCKTNIIEWL